MAEKPKTAQTKQPSTRELLERIVALEEDNARLKAQLKVLETDHEKLCGFFGKHVRRLDDRLLGIDDQLIEVLEKLFPGHARTQLQIREALKPGRTDEPS